MPSKLNYAIANDPRRSPSWRYERVIKLLDQRRPPHPKYDDKFISEYRRFRLISDQVKAKTDDPHIAQCILSEKFPHLWHADRLFFEGGDSRVRWGVEAMMLTRMTSEEIAAQLNCHKQVIDFYEQLFFNVRDRLDQRHYIASIVLQDAFLSGLGARTPEITCKYFAYYAGPLILGVVQDAFDPANAPPDHPHEIAKYLEGHFKTAFRASVSIGATFLEPTNFNMRSLLENYQAMMSLQYRERENQGDDNIINQAIEVFARTNPPLMGDEARGVATRPGPMIAGGAVEPRVDEIQEVTDNPDADIFKQYSSNWRLPAPENPQDPTAK